MVRFAVPLAEGKLSMHFGHCAEFALVDTDPDTRTIVSSERIPAPPHQPGLLPVWLNQRGANVVIAGGMGARARTLFSQQGITVVVGAAAETPEAVVAAYLDGSLQTGDNLCDHPEPGAHGGGCHGRG